MATVFWDTKILKDGGKRYYVRSKVNDVRRSHGACRTLREAQSLKGEILKSIADGTYSRAPRQNLTLSEFSKQWLAAKEKTLKQGTWTDYELTFRLHILPGLGDKLLEDISPQDVQNWVNSLSKKRLSRTSINKCYRYLRNCLNNAEAKDIISRTPCRGVIVPRPPQQIEFDILSIGEVAKVIEAADEPEKTLVAVLAYTGIRLGESLGLKWRDIDFENNCIRVERTFGIHGWSTPKTSASRRAVPLSPTLASMLSDYRASRDATGPENVVFSHDGTTPLDQSNVRRDFNRALKAAEIRHVSLHSLRHFYASNMIASGCSIKFLQNALGHSSATMTLNTYSHLIPESGAESVARFDALINGAATTVAGRKEPKRSREQPHKKA
jgi:integrase